jgi:hypothetical protein
LAERDWPRFAWNLVIVLISAAMIGLVLPAGSLGWRDRGFTGVAFDRSTGVAASVEAGSPAARAGVRSGDRIVASSLGPGDAIRLVAPPPGAAFAFDVRRGNELKAVTYVAARAPSAYPPLFRVLLATEILSFVAFVVIGGVLAILRPGAMTFWLFAFCIGTAPLDAVIPFYTWLPTLPLEIFFVWARTFLSGFSALPLLPFVLRFPSDTLVGWRRRLYAPAVALVLACAAYYFVLAILVATEFVPLWRIYNDVPPIFAFAAGITFLLIGLYERRDRERERLRWAVLGTSIGFVVLLLDYVPGISTEIYPVANTLALIMPVAIGYAVFKQRLIDVRFFINRAAVYTVITFGLLVTIGLAEYLISRLVDEQHLLAYLTAAVSVVVGVVFNRVHERSEAFVERIIFHARFRAEERLNVIARGLRFAESVAAIDAALTIDASTEMHLTSAALYRRAPEGDRYRRVALCGPSDDTEWIAADATLVRNLRSELHALPREDSGGIAIPILSGQELIGFSAYGVHPGGVEIDPVEMRVLESLSAAAAVAYGNVDAAAFRREISELRARICELEAVMRPGPEGS